MLSCIRMQPDRKRPETRYGCVGGQAVSPAGGGSFDGAAASGVPLLKGGWVSIHGG